MSDSKPHSKPHIVITGANRGIGLALTENYLQQGARVTALCRQSSSELDATAATIITGVEVTDTQSLSRAAAKIMQPIDILINNAGILLNETVDDLNMAQIEQQLAINAVAPLRVFAAFKPLLTTGSKLGFITSRMGSIADNGSGSFYGYRMSKAALNAACKSLAIDLKAQGVSVAILHPGMVQTRMIGFAGDVNPTDAAQGLVARLEELSLSNSGTFWHANGEILPW
jgi:NAD(P)-dependent dehydrogenase (short-subunit alcohol dehydrogenase family)